MPNDQRYSPELVEAAYQILKEATRASPVTSEELGKKLAIDDIEGNWKARGLILEVIRQKRLPLIARGNRGYFVATSEDEIKEYVNDLYRRNLGNMERAVLVTMVFRESHPESDVGYQPSLDEEW